MIRAWLLLLLTFPLVAQQAVLQLDIAGDWRFQHADNPDFAKPDFDDTKWATMRLPRTGGQPVGYWWLRRTVEIPEWADTGQLALTLGGMNEVYEVFLSIDLSLLYLVISN